MANTICTYIYILYVEYINDFVPEVICGNVISYWPSNIEHASTTSISHSFHHTWSIWNLNIIAQNSWPPPKTKMITVTVRFDLFSPYFFQPTKINNTHILTISIGVYHGSCEVANIGGSLDSKLLGAPEQMGKTVLTHPGAPNFSLMTWGGWRISRPSPPKKTWALKGLNQPPWVCVCVFFFSNHEILADLKLLVSFAGCLYVLFKLISICFWPFQLL